MTTAHEKMPDTIDFADADFTAASHVNKCTLLSDEAMLNIARTSLKRAELLDKLRSYVSHHADCPCGATWSAKRKRRCTCGLAEVLALALQKK